MPDFNQQSFECFVFSGYEWVPETATLELHYALEPGYQFTETIQFPNVVAIKDSHQASLQNAFQLLHWVAGVSYWKTACPTKWRFLGAQPNARQLGFIHQLYVFGLSEFFYTNQIDIKAISDKLLSGFGDLLNQNEQEGTAYADELGLQNRSLVPLGGGKDSLVALRLIEQLDHPCTVTAVRPAQLIQDVAAQTGQSWLPIQRRVSPDLLSMNGKGALNGHVPITAINACVLIVAAILYDYQYIVFANEASADEPTRYDGQGQAVNHQYSKSTAFEQALQSYINHDIAADLRCFSLLRPLTELAICQQFSEQTKYHGCFSSCNRQFHLDGARITQRWCGHCPKCEFVFLALAPFMTKQALSTIFANNLLDNSDLISDFADLCGLGDKPFECVGSMEESRAAMQQLLQHADWQRDAVPQALKIRLMELPSVSFEALLTHDVAAVQRLPVMFRQVYEH